MSNATRNLTSDGRLAQRIVNERVDDVSVRVCLSGAERLVESFVDDALPQDFREAVANGNLHGALVAACRHLADTKGEFLLLEEQAARRVLSFWYKSSRANFGQHI